MLAALLHNLRIMVLAALPTSKWLLRVLLDSVDIYINIHLSANNVIFVIVPSPQGAGNDLSDISKFPGRRKCF